mmetsp:Transcript_34827/g.112316  ORF Transcript_34827/g.112316 Transcript_34827/m.112316 type:complete len:251 (-) Transcript_34827:73-825(-)
MLAASMPCASGPTASTGHACSCPWRLPPSSFWPRPVPFWFALSCDAAAASYASASGLVASSMARAQSLSLTLSPMVRQMRRRRPRLVSSLCRPPRPQSGTAAARRSRQHARRTRWKQRPRRMTRRCPHIRMWWMAPPCGLGMREGSHVVEWGNSWCYAPPPFVHFSGSSRVRLPNNLVFSLFSCILPGLPMPMWLPTDRWLLRTSPFRKAAACGLCVVDAASRCLSWSCSECSLHLARAGNKKNKKERRG